MSLQLPLFSSEDEAFGVPDGFLDAAADRVRKSPHPANSLGRIIDDYFHITARGSNIKQELFAGLINFVANSYLLVLTPQLLEKGGLDPDITYGAFIVTTVFTSIFLGLTSNLPLAVGPGLGCATFVAYGMPKTMPGYFPGVDVQTLASYSLTACFVASTAMAGIAVTGLPIKIFDAIPPPVKDAMPSGLGLLLALCGFQQMGLVVSNPITGVTMGDVTSPPVLLGCLCIFLIVYMEDKTKAYFLLPLVITTGLAWALQLAPSPSAWVELPSICLMWMFRTDWLGWWLLEPICALYVITLFDVAGIMNAVAHHPNEAFDKPEIEALTYQDGSVKGAYWVFLSCGLGSVMAATLGCSPVIIFGEAFAGVLVGGRTGLTAVSMAACFALCVWLHPVVKAVPLFASAPVLVVVGVSLTALSRFLQWSDPRAAFVSFTTLALMPFLYSIDRAITAGLVAHYGLRLMDLIVNLATCGQLATGNGVGGKSQPAEADGSVAEEYDEPAALAAPSVRTPLASFPLASPQRGGNNDAVLPVAGNANYPGASPSRMSTKSPLLKRMLTPVSLGPGSTVYSDRLLELQVLIHFPVPTHTHTRIQGAQGTQARPTNNTPTPQTPRAFVLR
jgi:AGZA family xanthine/uracil permease-like MFS transporter